MIKVDKESYIVEKSTVIKKKKKLKSLGVYKNSDFTESEVLGGPKKQILLPRFTNQIYIKRPDGRVTTLPETEIRYINGRPYLILSRYQLWYRQEPHDKSCEILVDEGQVFEFKLFNKIITVNISEVL